ncbi:HAD family phosphatase [Roseibium denhamense]|uniref:Haloacid dehalogenase superfamily, subfamily IA, variant 3 with third motif having DD or ED n=1 Tax=Roseibium denhamense TaxID=76305 RepID=A0ABY1PEE7_9HYPH|nr:HAD family phosphatase [Roseibium denhamense]MTI04603.1 HAD family phosphatase [Roseibium denhamense]SMP31099.1 haloacid dehalogenase superfamily, subfamily IA, variant 3 with third motif having DD or ED [Roseibium denhamense]
MGPSLVIFDCDGVLVDTERVTNANMAEIVTELGHPMTGPECQRTFMGRTLENVQELIEELIGRHLPADWPEQVRRRDFESFQKGVDAIPGVAAVLDDLDSCQMPYCVGSSGKYSKMRTTLGSSGLLGRLEGRLFSAEDCTRGKPAPDVFLLAADKMGFDPKDCVVIEDSLPGVQAAVAAGMAVYAYVEDPSCDRKALLEAGAVLFERMSDLPELLFANS